MSEKNNHAMLDHQAFYEVVEDKFRDTSFIAQGPAADKKFSLIVDSHETIDPNDDDQIVFAGRDGGAWFLKASWVGIVPSASKVQEDFGAMAV